MERKDIETQYTWDLSLIYQNNDEFKQDYDQATQLIEELLKAKGKLTKSKESLLTFLKQETLLSRIVEKLYVYGHLMTDVEPNNQDAQNLFAQAQTLISQLSSQFSFVQVELLKHANEVKQYMEDPLFESFRFSLEQVIRLEDHTNSEEVEQILGDLSPVASTAYRTFSVLRPDFDPVMVDGKEEFLNQATLSIFLKNKDQAIRKQAYQNFYTKYQELSNVFASTLIGKMANDCFYAKAKRFNSALEASLFEDNAPTSLFNKVLHKANKEYRHLLHDYFKLRKDILKLDEQYNYDLSVSLVDDVDLKFNLDQAYEIIEEATAPFGEEYNQIMKASRAERWVDFMPHTGKRGGAYSSGCYDTKPYILISYLEDYNSLSTLAHELGHSAHSFLSRKYQEPQNASYRIFVAEVASTVNEVLLVNLLLKKAKDEKEKAYLQASLLDECVGLIFRQPLYAEFELLLHATHEQGGTLSNQWISEQWFQLNKDYFGDSVILDPLTSSGCYMIPHFYYNFYVYKYTIGMCVALTISKRIIEGDQAQVERYLNFLKSGGSKYPIDLLKEAGVDPTDDAVYDEAFQYFGQLLEEFKQVMTK